MRRTPTVAIAVAGVLLFGVLPAGAASEVLECEPSDLVAGPVPPAGSPNGVVNRTVGRASSCLPEGEWQLPNLVPTKPGFVSIGPAPGWWDTFDPLDVFHDPPPPGDHLRFPTIIANRGPFHLDIFSEPTRGAGTWSAQQCIRFEGRVCLERVDVGEIVWHPAHRHWHFADFVLHELRSLTAHREPDFSDEGVVSSSGKMSFCLQDSRQEEGDEVRFYDRCLGVIQGISAGWADIYDTTIPGQHLDIEGVPDGEYALVHTVDPDGRLHETTELDNVAWSVVELSEENGKRQASVLD